MSSTKSQTQFSHILQTEIDSIKAAGTYKSERVIVSPQHSDIRVAGKDGKITPQINFCANNYLGNWLDLISALNASTCWTCSLTRVVSCI